MRHFSKPAFSGVFLLLSVFAYGDALDWKIKRDSWNADDEKQFSAFVASLGNAVASRKCGTLDLCLKSEANPYRESDLTEIKWFSDCADLPYTLRAYFAWKKGLPFGFVDEVEPILDPNPTPLPSTPPDERYSPLGNLPTERFSIVKRPEKQEFPKADFEISRIQNWVSSAMFRIGPDVDGGRKGADFYSVALTREALVPGTVIYDPNGHVAVVYGLTDDGQVNYFDAHPDGSLTHGVFGEKFMRSKPGQGAGFKRFRALHLTGASVDSEGNYIGGVADPAMNSEIKDFDTVQYTGNDHGHFSIQGKVMDFYHFVRASLTLGKYKINPIDEVTQMIRAICSDVRDRVDAVQISVRDGIDQKPHPETLPLNIFGADGEWESYATPSRDARIKASFRELHDRAFEYFNQWKAKDPTILFTGKFLKRDLIHTVQTEMSQCQISYLRSDQTTVNLNLQQIEDRLFKLSFDPYVCAELRWGAMDSSDEISTCTSIQNSRDWYQAEQYLRNWIDRRYDVVMGFNLDQTQHFGEGTPLYSQSPDISTIQMLTKLRE